MKLVAEMEEKTSRLARETTGGGEGKVGGNQEVRDVGGVYLSGDSMVVAGRAGVFQNSFPIGCNPYKTEDGGGKSRGGGPEVVKT